MLKLQPLQAPPSPSHPHPHPHPHPRPRPRPRPRPQPLFRWPLTCAICALFVVFVLLRVSFGVDVDVRSVFFPRPQSRPGVLPNHHNHHNHHNHDADTHITPAAASASALETCAWQALEPHVSLLDVPAINRSDFLRRQRVLASALRTAGVDAFVAEPSASSTYYANISARFSLSERPYLIILDSHARFSYLVPQFETGRLNPESQHMVFEGAPDSVAIPWREELSPYAVLLESGRLGRAQSDGGRRAKVMIDEHARHMIAAGLQAVGVHVVPMSDEVKQLRAVKTDAEIAILTGINSFTRQLVRALQGCIRLGVTQEDVVAAGRALFTRAGVGEGYWAIALFGSQAAYPHGGKSGAVLQDGEFVLLDIGSVLHGYGSDVTRTFLPPGVAASEELMGIWQTVRRSQTAGFDNMRPNGTCRDADAASRVPVEEAGYGPFYTHRLGHGLGLEVHEHPYLNGANYEKLRAGMVATNEPGIYVTNEQAAQLGKSNGFGVRLEDPILVTQDGGVPLTGRRAESPWDT
ncbi:Creatinase/aminopeptidase [Xylaria cf. heliscus]|nr:Creatinase/aminopeptidase [Xylaria cf. heliscus]